MNKIVYLISPNEISKNFYNTLEKVLSFGNVEFFQLRLKKIKFNDVIKIAKKIRKITYKHNVKFIINDNYKLVSKIEADGCHMGQLDGSLKFARKKLRTKILGVTCHNSIALAEDANKNKANYLALAPSFNLDSNLMQKKQI